MGAVFSTFSPIFPYLMGAVSVLNQIEPDEDGLPELRPKIDFHFLR